MRSVMSVVNHGADRLVFVHQVEGFVDAIQRQRVGDERRKLDVAAHRVLDHAWQLRAPLHPAERGAQPLASGDQLERSRRNFLRSEEHTSELQSLMRTSYAV